MKIILAEDNPVNAELLRIMAQSLGLQIDLAMDGQELLTRMMQGRYHKVLMDLSMPVMDGIEAARRIRAGEAGEAHRQIPIVAVTAHDTPEMRRACETLGIAPFVVKPVTLGKLKPVLQAV